MREVFIARKLRQPKLDVIEQVNDIIEEYAAQGFSLTIRQLFYQFVARDLLPNTPKEYKALSSIISMGRDGGLIDWDAIEDRTREVNTHPAWDSPTAIIDGAAQQYRENVWHRQSYQPEVWVEKDALLGVISNVCTQFRVPYFSTRGNNSMTMMHDAGVRFAAKSDLGLTPVVLHLADHDPNGLDMTRDIVDRLARYSRRDIEVRRIALNMDQVRAYNPPPNFVKEKDSRTGSYRNRFGTDECWELDALSPTVIVDLISEELETMIDQPAWDKALAKEERGRGQLRKVAANWTKVRKL